MVEGGVGIVIEFTFEMLEKNFFESGNFTSKKELCFFCCPKKMMVKIFLRSQNAFKVYGYGCLFLFFMLRSGFCDKAKKTDVFNAVSFLILLFGLRLATFK